jgi:dihydropteroate synthase
LARKTFLHSAITASYCAEVSKIFIILQPFSINRQTKNANITILLDFFFFFIKMLRTPFIMVILNVTPDSFFDGGRFNSEKAWLQQVEKMLSEGVDILDVGGFSSRPGCDFVSEEEELRRVVPAVVSLKRRFPDVKISVDTFRSRVAQECVDAGASIINDISGGNIEPEIWDVVAENHHVKYVLMHGVESWETLHRNIDEHADIVSLVKDFLKIKMEQLQKKGIDNQRIILDPGFGFGKTTPQNYQLLHNLSTFAEMGTVMVGLSRKSMIWEVLGITPEESLQGTIALNELALMNGATYLRVHSPSKPPPKGRM